MIHHYTFVIFYLLMLCRPLWGQPNFSWPVDMGGVNNLTGNLGEPRAEDPNSPYINPLHHWHKGIDIPKTNELPIRIPAAGKVTYKRNNIVVLHHGIDGNPVGWHTRFLHVDLSDTQYEEGHILRPLADGTMPVLGKVTLGHCHLEVYQFGTEQNRQSLYENFGYVRNPLKYDNLDDYPDNDNPTVEEIQLSLGNIWRGTSALETTIGGQEKFKDLVRNSPEVYFLVRAYDDITDTGAHRALFGRVLYMHESRLSIGKSKYFQVSI